MVVHMVALSDEKMLQRLWNQKYDKWQGTRHFYLTPLACGSSYLGIIKSLKVQDVAQSSSKEDRPLPGRAFRVAADERVPAMRFLVGGFSRTLLCLAKEPSKDTCCDRGKA